MESTCSAPLSVSTPPIITHPSSRPFGGVDRQELENILLLQVQDNMTTLGIGKSVIKTDCHINRSCLVQEGLFGTKISVI